ncbi:MAG TPA: SPW repeat protein [Chitinispirillaceae bacterium]|nr:SPW repeat protein [Chitinispirillaceae bacterium]
MWQGWVNGILGVWLFITPFFYFTPSTYAWHNFIVGLVIGFCGFSMSRVRQWEGVLSILVGLWLVISTFIPVLRMYPGVYYNNMITGALAAIAGFSAVYENVSKKRPVQKPA